MSATDELAEAEQRVNELAPMLRLLAAPNRSGELTLDRGDAVALVAVLAEYDRRGQIEQRARDMVENPGRYDEDDVSVARYIVTGKTS